MNQQNLWLAFGASFAGLAVAFGAFGAHALANKLSTGDLEIYHTAVRYQMYHGLALLAVAILSQQVQSNLLNYAGWAFTIGTVIFSGSLYLLVLTNTRWLGAITPIGGVAMIIGWGLLVYAALSTR